MINRQIAVGIDGPVLDRVEVVCNTWNNNTSKTVE